jgi:hypothetical protein
VFRTAVIWIVLAMAAAPNTSLLCRVWCDTQGPAIAGCHHERKPAGLLRVTTVDTCDVMGLSDAPFVREDLRRRIAPPQASQAIGVISDHCDGLVWQAHTRSKRQSDYAFDGRPHFTALRI